jgi:hypothetical protein
MMRGQASLVRLARRELPPAVADRWIGLLQPSFWLRAADADEPVVGQLGGVPVLPDGLAWPHWNSHGPLTFVGEIDCGQLPSNTLSLPHTGTLSFFVQNDLPTVRGAPENLAVASVVYIPAGTPVTERDAPAGIDPYGLVELTGELHATGPAWDSPVLTETLADLGGGDRTFLNDWPSRNAFSQGLWDLAPEPRHQIGGHAFPVQDAVELDAAHTQLGGTVPYGDPALIREARRWTPLAQFDSDDAAGMRWGDCGTLYWLIRPADLAARRFEAASFTWQCY